MTERILLLQLDGKLPNLALMRLAAFHRERGNAVELRKAGNASMIERGLWDEPPDRVYASTIFQRTRPVAQRLLELHPEATIGGTGWDVTSRLPTGVEACAPDYSDYPAFRQSIGFTQRGCRLRCPFCVVPKKEGAVQSEATVTDVWRGDPWPREVLLLDNDFFGQPDWRDRIAELRGGRFRVSFVQGINARMIDREVAEAVASVNHRDDSMKRKRIYTAWDSKGDERRLFRGLQLLVDAGVKPDHIMVYMLIGYWPEETHEDRDYRRQRLREFGARPYPMAYGDSRELRGYQRWVIGAYDKSIPWSDWRSARYQPQRLVRAAQRSLFDGHTGKP